MTHHNLNNPNDQTQMYYPTETRYPTDQYPTDQGQYVGAPYHQPTARKNTNGWAVASLISAFFVPLLAIIFGHVSLHQLKNRPYENGHGLALAGTILGYIFTGITVIIILMISLLAASVSSVPA